MCQNGELLWIGFSDHQDQRQGVTRVHVCSPFEPFLCFAIFEPQKDSNLGVGYPDSSPVYLV